MPELSVGGRAPYFELPDQQSYPWSLSGQLEVGPVVLVFYRGDWCPYGSGQLAVYAREYDRFDGLGVQVAGLSVDPPPHNARMVGKLRLPFPLLSDPRGEVCRACGLWSDRENLAVSAVVILNRSSEVRFLHAGSDPADLPTNEEVFAALGTLDENAAFGSRIERLSGGPELRISATEARDESVRPARRAMDLGELDSYYEGAYSTTGILAGRFGALGRSGRRASREVDRHQGLLRAYARATRETVGLHQEES